jgi:hypothetical protein
LAQAVSDEIERANFEMLGPADRFLLGLMGEAMQFNFVRPFVDLYRELNGHRTRAAVEMGELASQLLTLDLAGLVELVNARPALASLFRQALEVVYERPTVDHVRALAHVVAEAAAGNEPMVDEGAEVARCLGSMSKLQMRALRGIRDACDARSPDAGAFDDVGSFIEAAIEQALGGDTFVDPIENELRNLGLVNRDRGRPLTLITPFGRRVLRYLQEQPIDIPEPPETAAPD